MNRCSETIRAIKYIICSYDLGVLLTNLYIFMANETVSHWKPIRRVLLFAIEMWIFNIIFGAMLCGYAYAKTEEEMKIEFTKIVMKCTKDHPVDMSELVQLQQLIPPKKMETKCLLACAYRTEGVMTEKGLYDIDHAYKIAEQTKNGDEKRLVNARKMADVCVKVNDIEVSDGEKGCERAGLIFKCTVENAPKFGFKI